MYEMKKKWRKRFIGKQVIIFTPHQAKNCKFMTQKNYQKLCNKVARKTTMQ
jgi:hypothetical protein